MAYQMRAVTGNPLIRRNQTAELNARMQYLPTLIAAKNRNADIARQEAMNSAQKAQWNRNYNLAKKQQKFAKKQSRIGMGLEAGKLGLGIIGSYGASKGDPSRGTLGGLFGGGNTYNGKAMGSPGGVGGLMSNLNLGNLVGGGLAGYGVSKVMGGKNKFAKAAGGALAGGLLSGLTGGGWGGAISGGLGGGIGGLFG